MNLMNDAEKILLLLHEAGGYDWKILKKNRIPLEPEEHQRVMSANAVWNFSPSGKPSPAVWKTRSKSGKLVYICNTHRACAIKPTLDQAIKAYDFIKTTS